MKTITPCIEAKGFMASAQREALIGWGPGARLRAPVDSRGKAPGRGPGGEAPGSSGDLSPSDVKIMHKNSSNLHKTCCRNKLHLTNL